MCKPIRQINFFFVRVQITNRVLFKYKRISLHDIYSNECVIGFFFLDKFVRHIDRFVRDFVGISLISRVIIDHFIIS